ncbi:MAG: nucleoside 2-deoxyribosyltransferase [Ruminococcaceae bacterium]|nr:nucleoside 2-deoxyribosyltransferase [Oscillospiraceae bacterium]
MKKIYLAGPFFNEKENALILDFAARLREKYDVFVPMEHTAEGDVPEGGFAWGKEIFDIDVCGLDGADLVVALDHGFTSDAGTAWETGYAYAKGKPSYIVAVGDPSPVRSLMLLHGCTRYFASLDDLMDFLDGKDAPTAEERGIKAK